MAVVKTHRANKGRAYIREVGIMNYTRLVKYLKKSEGPIIIEDDHAFVCVVRAMLKCDKDLKLHDIIGAIRSGGILEYIKEKEVTVTIDEKRNVTRDEGAEIKINLTSDGKDKTIGVRKDSSSIDLVKHEKDYFEKYSGFCLTKEYGWKKFKEGAKWLHLTLTRHDRSKRLYFIPLESVFKVGKVVHYPPQEEQIVIPLKYWTELVEGKPCTPRDDLSRFATKGDKEDELMISDLDDDELVRY